MSQRKAVTRATATRYRSASKGSKAVILDELCQLTGWHRDHARKALRRALGPRRVVTPRKRRAPTYGEDVMVALRKVWAVMDAPAGKRMAPFLAKIVGRLRAFHELDLDDATAAMLCAMSAATIDRRLAGERRRLELKGRSGTTTTGGAAAAAQLLAEHPEIDGLFVASDLMAVGALSVLAGAGRLVPGDVAVVGYDNLGAAITTSPTLTTIVNPVVAMARTAGEMLIDLLAGKTVDQAPVIFAPELVIRRSA